MNTRRSRSLKRSLCRLALTLVTLAALDLLLPTVAIGEWHCEWVPTTIWVYHTVYLTDDDGLTDETAIAIEVPVMEQQCTEIPGELAFAALPNDHLTDGFREDGPCVTAVAQHTGSKQHPSQEPTT